MRVLDTAERAIVAGGQTWEFRTVARHEIPRWEEPPMHWTLQAETPPATGPVTSPDPVPLRWLPCSDEWPGIF